MTSSSGSYSQEIPNYSETIKTDAPTSSPVFEIFGIKLYNDDLLILSLLFFLYSERVYDQELFLVLLLLLLS